MAIKNLTLSEEQLAAAKQCGIYAYPFKKVFIVLRIANDLQNAAEAHFYDTDSEFHKAYERGRVEYGMRIDSLLFTASTSNNKEERAFDRAAYEKLEARREDNLEQYEAEKREYFAKNEND